MAVATQIQERILVISGDYFEEHMTCIRTGAGLILTDTLATTAATARVLDQVTAFSREPVRFLINTHFDIDHYAGNELFPEAVIISHANCLNHYNYKIFDSPENARFIQELIDKLEVELVSAEDSAEVERKHFYITQYRNLLEGFSAFHFTPPHLLLHGSCQLRLGDVNLELIYAGPGHTDADLIIHIPCMKLLIAGDLVLGPNFIPVVHGIHNGSAANFENILEKILSMQADWEYLIPGHGSLCGSEAVRDQLDYLKEMRLGIRQALESHLTLEQSRGSLQLDRFRHHLLYEFAHVSNLDAAWKEAAHPSS
jgi:glyoxylase-like metal-dependent hydrolase (beta-lactamase superfamily II)